MIQTSDLPAYLLASLSPGESGTVVSFLFGTLRSLCDDLGIREGETVRCRAGTAGVLILDTQDGHTVSVARGRTTRSISTPAWLAS